MRHPFRARPTISGTGGALSSRPTYRRTGARPGRGSTADRSVRGGLRGGARVPGRGGHALHPGRLRYCHQRRPSRPRRIARHGKDRSAAAGLGDGLGSVFSERSRARRGGCNRGDRRPPPEWPGACLPRASLTAEFSAQTRAGYFVDDQSTASGMTSFGARARRVGRQRRRGRGHRYENRCADGGTLPGVRRGGPRDRRSLRTPLVVGRRRLIASVSPRR